MTSTVNAVSTFRVGYGNDGAIGAMTDMSPDSLLAYCRIQLGALDDQVTSQMNTQELELAQRTAVQKAQTALEAFGDQGPQTGDQMHTCVIAFQDAINQLPAGDPVGAQLQSQLQEMTTKYGYEDLIATPIPGALVQARAPNPNIPKATGNILSALQPAGSPASAPPAASQAGPGTAPGSKEVFRLDTPPQNNDWKGTIDAVGNLADNIKSNAEIQMLTLQDLVSQRQQVVALATGIMSKVDQTLTDGAKAIGQ